MNVAQLFTELSYGELSNLSLSGDGSGMITDQAKPRVLIAANECLVRLYTRFILKENDLLLELVDHITVYHFLKKFAESQWETSTQDYLYIKDLMREQFSEDVIKVLVVYDSYGCALPLNDPDHPESVYTPQGNMLQVPRPVTGLALSVGYQAKHAPLVLNEAMDAEIELPDVLWGAFKAYVAYHIYNGINTQEAKVTAQEHLSRYESICSEVVMQDLVSTSLSSINTRFRKNGWK